MEGKRRFPGWDLKGKAGREEVGVGGEGCLGNDGKLE